MTTTLKVTNVQFLTLDKEGKDFTANFSINHRFIIQYTPTEGFTIPAPGKQYWNNKLAQNDAYALLNATLIAGAMYIPTGFHDIELEYSAIISGARPISMKLRQVKRMIEQWFRTIRLKLWPVDNSDYCREVLEAYDRAKLKSE